MGFEPIVLENLLHQYHLFLLQVESFFPRKIEHGVPIVKWRLEEWLLPCKLPEKVDTNLMWICFCILKERTCLSSFVP